MSGVPEVVNTSAVEYNALVKKAFFTNINVTVIEGWCTFSPETARKKYKLFSSLKYLELIKYN